MELLLSTGLILLLQTITVIVIALVEVTLLIKTLVLNAVLRVGLLWVLRRLLVDVLVMLKGIKDWARRTLDAGLALALVQIGRASCRERVL